MQDVQNVQNLEEIMAAVQEQQAVLERLAAAANMYGTVVAAVGDHFAVATDGKVVRVTAVPDVGVGHTVVLCAETGQILEASPPLPLGGVATYVRALDANRLLVEAGGQNLVKVAGPQLDATQLEAGCQLLLDASTMVVVQRLAATTQQFQLQAPQVPWAAVGGNEEAKLELQEALQIIKGGTELHAKYGVRAPKGILLYGPPGCGKTMLGKAAATELAGQGAGAFLYVKATELLNKYVGESEARIRALFEGARQHQRATGQAAVIFVDEADAILQRRGTGVSSDMEKTIVPAFLTEMDGLEDSGAFIILATNRPETLDPAVIRDGRIDRRISVQRPSPQHGQDIFLMNLRELPVAPGNSAEQLAAVGAAALYRQDGKMAQHASGAMIAAAVERAKRSALRRDAASGCVGGLQPADLATAVAKMEEEY